MSWGLSLAFEAVTAVATVGSATAVVVAAYQVRALRQQLQDTRDWNRMSAAFQYLPNPHQMTEFECDLNGSCIKLIDRTKPLSPDELSRLMSDEETDSRLKLKNYLNLLEMYCVAINHGIVDSDVAKSMYDYKFRRHFVEMKPYIDQQRDQLNAPSLWR